MAFTIRIYEKNGYIYSLLRKRLSCFFPDAYIVNPFFDEQDYEDRFSDFTRVLYDPADINEEAFSANLSTSIRLTDDGGVIDCARIISMIKPKEDTQLITRKISGSFTAVIPFVAESLGSVSAYTDVNNQRFGIFINNEVAYIIMVVRLSVVSTFNG